MEEPDIVYSRGAFPDVQNELSVFPPKLINGVFSCGWYGTAIDPERGSFAIVNADGPLGGKVGDYVRVSYLSKSVTVYCVEALSIPYDLVLARRAYYQLAELWTSYLNVRVSDIADSTNGPS